MDQIINYILTFLLGVEKASAYASLIGYTSNPNLFHRYRVVIIPSRFFDIDVYGTTESLPKFPLMEIEGIPFLYGSPREEMYDDTLIIYADLIASSYFLMTRYEEIQKRSVRDAFGRFPGKESLPYKAGFINRPIIEEYGKLLRERLRRVNVPILEPNPGLDKIWLTHDIDAPFFCRTFRNLLREIVKRQNIFKAIKYYTGPLENDPYYTFPWMLQENEKVKAICGERCETVFFLKAGGKTPYDKPHYKHWQKDVKLMLALMNQHHCLFGLHTSFEASEQPSLISQEKNTLDHVWNLESITMNRHHFLSLREPEDFDKLMKAGITEDFTMGYADVAGFRLGTCRPVRWINPITRQLTSLTLHPLTVMDCTLSDAKYMNLRYEEALTYTLLLIKKIREYGGEVVTLWHNTSFAFNNPCPYHRHLYTLLLKELTI